MKDRAGGKRGGTHRGAQGIRSIFDFFCCKPRFPNEEYRGTVGAGEGGGGGGKKGGVRDIRGPRLRFPAQQTR